MQESLGRGSEGPEAPEAEARISDVVRRTGLSKELIHHYLRLGLVPRSDARGRYTPRQIRLLELVRTLREDHNLPLEVARSLFEAFGFAAERLESLTQSESLCTRITRFADGSLIAPETLDEGEVAHRSGVSTDRVRRYVRAGILSPTEAPGGERFSPYDASVVALCEQGVGLGIPFESLRTAASYVHVAFELEKDGFFGDVGAGAEPDHLIRELFLRQEVVLSFVQNMLQSVTQRHLRLELGATARGERSVDEVVYRPSDAFVRRHRLDRRIDQARARCLTADGAEPWCDAAEVLLHAGRYHEAVFMLEDCARRWPDAPVDGIYGRAVLLAGDAERGAQLLDTPPLQQGDDPRVGAYAALALLLRGHDGSRPEALVEQSPAILRRVEQALLAARQASLPHALESRMWCGWLLSALPRSVASAREGRRLLAEVLTTVTAAGLGRSALPGLRERLELNTAYLLLRSGGDRGAEQGPNDAPEPEQLRARICRLDPASAFAEAVFLDGHGPTTPTETTS